MVRFSRTKHKTTAKGGGPGSDKVEPPAFVVQVEAVSKSFRKGERIVHALSRVDVSVKHREFVALVGPSGCGKSTLLRMMGGLSSPSEGSILVNGAEMREPRREIGLMLQHPTLFPWRTVVQNVVLPVEVRRRPLPEDYAKARQLIELVGLERFADHYPRELSGGMQQRAALCRLLITDPALMLLDEPFGALDEFTRENLNVELGSIVADKDVSVVLVTHSIVEAIFLADKIIALGGHPGEVRGEVEVSFERPRPVSVMREGAFLKRVVQVRALLGLE